VQRVPDSEEPDAFCKAQDKRWGRTISPTSAKLRLKQISFNFRVDLFCFSGMVYDHTSLAGDEAIEPKH